MTQGGMAMSQGEASIHYWPGKQTEGELNRQFTYVVETIGDEGFVFVGTVTVTMREVFEAMDATRNIKDNTPNKFAKLHAREKYPDANPVIVLPIEEWVRIYGNLSNYKRGDTVN